MDKLDPQDQAALTVTRVAIETGRQDFAFARLVERIAELRKPRTGRRRQRWVARLAHWSESANRDLAAAILYHVVRARLWAESADLDPLLSTVGAALGADLIGPTGDDEPMKVGCQLLGIAENVGIIALANDVRGGIHVALTDATFRGVQSLVSSGAQHVLRRVHTKPPRGVETKKKHSMLLARPEAPARVVEAADKIQGTAWRINQAVLDALDTPEWRLHEPSLQKELTLGEAQELTALDRFYFPVFLDFRGRMFQRAGVLNYTNAPDYARGLLEFADGEFVDDVGVKWLAWHMAQMWGKDLPYIPLGDGSAWAAGAETLRWQDAKHPVQFLAARLAWLDGIEGRPVHMPVRLDASCSGLQHLALLSADQDLAKLVNLWGDYHGNRQGMAWLETEDPNDNFYQSVAELTDFDRPHVKAVIMPMLYGAGEETSAEGLAEKRDERLSKRQRKDAGQIRTTAEQLARNAFGLLRWFGEVAKAHNDADVPVRWTTPSGFEAVQDYRYVEENPTRPDRQVQIIVNDRMRNLVKRFHTSALDKVQQVVSMPSSIVHSLDAALLTEIVAGSSIDQWGVVHDAFAVPSNRAWELLEDNQRATGHLYSPDRLAEWVAAWRAEGIEVSDPPGGNRGPLPHEMLGGLRTIGG